MSNPTYIGEGAAFATAPEEPNPYLRTDGHAVIRRKIDEIVRYGSVRYETCQVMIAIEGSIRVLQPVSVRAYALDLFAIMSSGNLVAQVYLRNEIVCGPEGIGQRVKAYNPLFDNDWGYRGHNIDESMLVHFYLSDVNDRLQIMIQRPEMDSVVDTFISQRCKLYTVAE